jgi:hypothetical protein
MEMLWGTQISKANAFDTKRFVIHEYQSPNRFHVCDIVIFGVLFFIYGLWNDTSGSSYYVAPSSTMINE